MKNVMCVIEYIGTDYCGFQVQKNGVSVAAKIEEAIYAATGQTVKVTGSGRTDAGVHALGQVINFFIDTSLPIDKMPVVLNRYLPQDIRVLSAREVDEDFNARKSAKRKTYIYRMDTSEIQGVFEVNRSMYVGKALNVDNMCKAAETLIGEHDFKAFMASGSQVTNTLRTVYSVAVSVKRNIVTFEICGNGFLYNMVRIIVGTLIDIGLGRKSVDTISKMILTGNRRIGGNTAKACGLYLKKVEYK